ncbi:hypothetical protein [Tenacibaculum sp. IB213877]|uniref:hypothetical protein n=1 Tax=Tenacibaculum sp. IB213877 TaxID=3097351 RepID=UPI002A5AEB29|nr:hypothetical protein [Tenacibaculum sp. IB213877]MDY0780388.1 hypothetical protein [Tenacibaculum sp. IB213877]
MLLVQNIEDSKAYKAGFETGIWIAHNPIISGVLAIFFLLLLVRGVTKVLKQIRTFGE